MSVIPVTQLALMRKRREIKQSLHNQDWKDILRLESELFPLIDSAIDDLHRSPVELLKELGRLIAVYRELSDKCQYYRGANHSPVI